MSGLCNILMYIIPTDSHATYSFFNVKMNEQAGHIILQLFEISAGSQQSFVPATGLEGAAKYANCLPLI